MATQNLVNRAQVTAWCHRGLNADQTTINLRAISQWVPKLQFCSLKIIPLKLWPRFLGSNKLHHGGITPQIGWSANKIVNPLQADLFLEYIFDKYCIMQYQDATCRSFIMEDKDWLILQEVNTMVANALATQEPRHRQPWHWPRPSTIFRCQHPGVKLSTNTACMSMQTELDCYTVLAWWL